MQRWGIMLLLTSIDTSGATTQSPLYISNDASTGGSHDLRVPGFLLAGGGCCRFLLIGIQFKRATAGWDWPAVPYWAPVAAFTPAPRPMFMQRPAHACGCIPANWVQPVRAHTSDNVALIKHGVGVWRLCLCCLHAPLICPFLYWPGSCCQRG